MPEKINEGIIPFYKGFNDISTPSNSIDLITPPFEVIVI
jgi:hypothetical protein